MLVHDFIQIRSPLASVMEQLSSPGQGWLAADASSAYAEGEELWFTLRPRIGPVRVAKRVQVDVGTPRPMAEGTLIPISWCASGPTRLFPMLEADLEVSAMGEKFTVLTLMGRYQPPLGPVGRGLDHLLMHRVAEASVRSFLERIGARLEAVAA